MMMGVDKEDQRKRGGGLRELKFGVRRQACVKRRLHYFRLCMKYLRAYSGHQIELICDPDASVGFSDRWFLLYRSLKYCQKYFISTMNPQTQNVAGRHSAADVSLPFGASMGISRGAPVGITIDTL